MVKFEVHWKDVLPSKTRRGIRTIAKLRLVETKVEIATLDDLPEAIVADVDFTDNKYHDMFLAEAREVMAPKFVELYGPELAGGFGDAMYISEYARELLQECIDAYMKKRG